MTCCFYYQGVALICRFVTLSARLIANDSTLLSRPPIRGKGTLHKDANCPTGPVVTLLQGATTDQSGRTKLSSNHLNTGPTPSSFLSISNFFLRQPIFWTSIHQDSLVVPFLGRSLRLLLHSEDSTRYRVPHTVS